jgi:thiol-disulfide isomerase/thioredoxin
MKAIFIAALFGACFLTPVSLQAATPADALLHKHAPAFTRNNLAGKPIDLRAYRGKVILLNFWATWCGPCQVELPRFAAWQEQYAPQGLQVIAVSMDDDAAPVRALARELKLNFPVVMGDAKLGALYGGILGLPVTFLIGRDGTIDARLEGGTDLLAMETSIRQLLAQGDPSSTSMLLNLIP